MVMIFLTRARVITDDVHSALESFKTNLQNALPR
jgi:hypothetical protein